MCLLTFHVFFFLGAPLGLLWYHLGAFWGALSNLLEPVGTLGGAPVELCVALWTTLGAPGRDFGASRGPFGVRLGCVWCRFGRQLGRMAQEC